MDKLKLLYEMHSRGITAEKMCKDINIGRSTFSKKCNGKSEFTLDEIKRIVNYLGLESPMDIFFCQISVLKDTEGKKNARTNNQ